MIKLDNNFVIRSNNFKKADSMVVFLHGYGSNGDDFVDVAEMFADEIDNAVFISPNAPFDCELGFGYQWFSLKDISFQEIRFGIDFARPYLSSFIKSVCDEFEVSESKVSLIGFSQGSMMALDSIFHLNGLDKVIAFSGLLDIPPEVDSINKDAKVILIHGSEDEVVPFCNMEISRNQLEAINIDVSTHTCYQLGHSISKEGLDVALKFLSSR